MAKCRKLMFSKMRARGGRWCRLAWGLKEFLWVNNKASLWSSKGPGHRMTETHIHTESSENKSVEDRGRELRLVQSKQGWQCVEWCWGGGKSTVGGWEPLIHTLERALRPSATPRQTLISLTLPVDGDGRQRSSQFAQTHHIPQIKM